jgi:hypothetical protein
LKQRGKGEKKRKIKGKNMKKNKHIILLTLLLASYGCSLEENNDINSIINRNYQRYNQSEVDFDNFAAILKEYSTKINQKEYNSVENIKETSDKFVKNLNERNISKNYPVKATKSEIELFKSLINDLTKWMEKEKITKNLTNYYINKSFGFFVEEIIQKE